MKKPIAPIVFALVALILLSCAGCLKYTGNILEVTKPGTEIPAFVTDAAPLGATTVPYAEPAAQPTDSAVPSAETPSQQGVDEAPQQASDPSGWTTQQIVDYVNKSMTQTRAYAGNLTAGHKETITATLTKAPGGALLQSIANPIIESAIKPTDETLSFSNGQAVDSQNETVPILLPKKATFSLSADGVASAAARADGADTVIDITLVRELGTLDAAPQYNAAAIGYLNAGMVDLSAVTITACNITYPGSTIKLRINPSGYVVTADYNVPYVVEASGKAMFISADVVCEGNNSESWVLNW